LRSSVAPFWQSPLRVVCAELLTGQLSSDLIEYIQQRADFEEVPHSFSFSGGVCAIARGV